MKKLVPGSSKSERRILIRGEGRRGVGTTSNRLSCPGNQSRPGSKISLPLNEREAQLYLAAVSRMQLGQRLGMDVIKRFTRRQVMDVNEAAWRLVRLMQKAGWSTEDVDG